MMIGNTNDPTGAATPIVGPGHNSCTDCITIPLEEYKKLIECSVNMDIIKELAGDKNVYKTLAGSSDMVPIEKYQELQNTSAETIARLRQELDRQAELHPAHICPVCERVFYEEPAISRRDPGLKICSVCATTEALEDAQAAGAISKGEANEILEIVEEVVKETEPEEMMEDVPAGEEEEVVPRPSTPEQCSKGGKKTQRKKKADLPMDEIRKLKAEGWSNRKIAEKYGVADVTIAYWLKKDNERELTVEDLRRLRREGWSYEKIESTYGIAEEKIREMLREAGRAERGESND